MLLGRKQSERRWGACALSAILLFRRYYRRIRKEHKERFPDRSSNLEDRSSEFLGMVLDPTPKEISMKFSCVPNQSACSRKICNGPLCGLNTHNNVVVSIFYYNQSLLHTYCVWQHSKYPANCISTTSSEYRNQAGITALRNRNSICRVRHLVIIYMCPVTQI